MEGGGRGGVIRVKQAARYTVTCEHYLAYCNEYAYLAVERIHHSKPTSEVQQVVLYKPQLARVQQKGLLPSVAQDSSCGIAIKRFRKHNFWKRGLSKCHCIDAPTM